MASLSDNPILGHISTFGGHPVCCASSLAALEVIMEERLVSQVETKEKLFRQLLVHPKIKNIRSKGLMMAIEFESFTELKNIIDKAIDNGLLTDWFLHCDNSMRIAPPLTITEAEIKEACLLLLKSIKG
jgi:acetylornithine/succinyldiaminopimelate/putrescine aminotransferase